MRKIQQMENGAMRVKWLAAAVLMVLSAGAAHATEGVVIGDTYVNSAHPAVNYGSLSNLYVNPTGTTLIQFDLSSLPAGTTASQIGAASLKLYVNRINISGPVSVKPITGSWSESTLTYSSFGSLTLGTATASFTPATAQQFIVIDVTSLVQGWVTTPASNNGIALTTTTGDVVFDSKENDETGHAAHLDITVMTPATIFAYANPQGLPGSTGASAPAGQTGPAGPAGPAGSYGTGESPTGIPLSIGGNTGRAAYNRPGGSVGQATLNAEVVAMAPAACTPSMKIWSYSGTSTTWVLAAVTPSISPDTWTIAAVLANCVTSSSAGSTCTMTGVQQAESTPMVLISNGANGPEAPGGGGFIQAFSCQ